MSESDTLSQKQVKKNFFNITSADNPIEKKRQPAQNDYNYQIDVDNFQLSFINKKRKNLMRRSDTYQDLVSQESENMVHSSLN